MASWKRKHHTAYLKPRSSRALSYSPARRSTCRSTTTNTRDCHPTSACSSPTSTTQSSTFAATWPTAQTCSTGPTPSPTTSQPATPCSTPSQQPPTTKSAAPKTEPLPGRSSSTIGPSLLEVRAKTVYPYLYQWCSYAPLCYTRPPSPNWKLQAGSDTTLFWRYQVHQPTEEVAYPTTDKYYPEVAYTLMWKKLTTTKFTVTIMLGSLRRPDRLTLGNRYHEHILWTITPDGTLDPPSPIAHVNIPLWQQITDD